MFNQRQDRSIFNNHDHIGVDSFRKGAEHKFSGNLTRVKLIRYNEKKGVYKQGDFSGFYHKQFEDTACFIEINIMSTAPDKEELVSEGYENDGRIIFDCYAAHDLEISNRDLVEFISDYGYQVKAGMQFRVEVGDKGLYQGLHTYKVFTLTKITA